MSPRRTSLGRNDRIVLLGTWVATLAAVVVLWSLVPQMPERIPVLRTLLGKPIVWSLRTPLLVCRVALMNLAFLGISFLMLREAWRAQHTGWIRFFKWSGIAVAMKGVLESAQMALLATQFGELAFPWLYGATVLVILGFLGFAAALMARGQLNRFPRLSAFTALLIALCIAAWAGLASFPVWGGLTQ